jgi:hypothetical protein
MIFLFLDIGGVAIGRFGASALTCRARRLLSADKLFTVGRRIIFSKNTSKALELFCQLPSQGRTRLRRRLNQ